MKLFALYLGGRAEHANIEVHDVVFIVAEKVEHHKEKIRQLWFGSSEGVHIDAIAEVSKVDGYKINVGSNKNSTHGNHLWFINFGATIPSLFSEYHENGFVVAPTKQSAIEKAKNTFCLNFKGIHTDSVVEVEDCVNVTEQLQNINLIPDAGNTQIQVKNCYIILEGGYNRKTPSLINSKRAYFSQ
ncbi:DUF1543 domain-containing protein [Candidatus Gracilibacteria bacterium]|nr:DUF1543 domain-containing protein [Candidatus Gracilibacteria bacterium]